MLRPRLPLRHFFTPVCCCTMDDIDDHDENAGAGYAWEKGFERTWEGVEEDEHGNIKAREDGQRRNRRVRRRVGG